MSYRLACWLCLLVLVSGRPLAAPSFQAERIAPGVYVIPAPLAETSPANRGHVVNTGFIVGRRGVIVIDSGANRRHGAAILATVRRVTAKPVRLVINTHPHPQNVLGNSAFGEGGMTILASAETRRAMQQRCERCVRALTESVGAAAMQGTVVRLPDRTVSGGERIEIAGRSLQLFHFGHGHTEGDLLVLDEMTGVMFSGDLVYRDQIPHLTEADTRGWLGALDRLAALDTDILVPGRGPVSDRQAVTAMRDYLAGLRQRVGEAYGNGLSADEAITYADLPAFAEWQGYAARHGVNVQHVYFELEREEFGVEVKP